MIDKKLLTLVGAVGGTNLLVTILTAFLVTGGVAGPAGSQGLPGSNGLPGSSGQPGTNGTNGQSPYIGNNGNWWIGSSDTGVSAGGIDVVENENFIVKQYDLLTDSITLTELQPLTMDTEWETRIREDFIPLTSQEDLQGMVDGGAYILANDITLTEPWTPLSYEGDPLSIHLDGNGHTISGLIINGDGVSQSPVGFFSRLSDSIIFDLTFDTPVVNKPQVYAQAGVLAGQIETSWLKNITIQGGEVNGVKELGMLAGRIGTSEVQGIDLIDNTLTAISYTGALAYNVFASLVHDVLVSNLTFEPNFAAAFAISLFDFQGDVGGLIGLAQSVELQNITVTNTMIDLVNGSYTNDYRYNVERIGGVVGRANGNDNHDTNFLRFNNIFVNNTTILGDTIGGIIGKLENAAIMLTNVNVISSNLYAGILGGASDTVDLENLTETNFSNLSSQVGGFIGVVDDSGVLIMDTYVNATLIGQDYIGGYIGEYSGDDNEHEFTYFKNAVSDSTIVVKDYSGGGFAGYLGNIKYVIFENSANLSNVDSLLTNSPASSVGGFVGELYEIDSFVLVSNSYNTGNVVGSYQVGGFFGYNEIEGLDNDGLENGGLILYNVYNIGDVYGNEDVGGFVGEQYDQENIMEFHNAIQAGQFYTADGLTPDFSSNEYGAFVGENTSGNSIIRNFNSFYLEQQDENDAFIPTIADDGSSSFNQGGNNGSGLPMTGFITLLTSGSMGESGDGSVTDLDAFTDENEFYFDGIWNFEEAWTFDFTQDGFPTLIHSYRPS
jgi:hypothetical protein